MTPDDLGQLLRQGRSSRLDWMGDGAPLEAMASTLAAMANTQGGSLVVGVSGPAGTVVGVRDTDQAQDRVLQAALSLEPPLIIPLPRVIRMNEKPVVVAVIPPGMPHLYAHDGRYLYRQSAENAALKPRDLRRLLIERGEVSFEMEIPVGATADDIDWDKAKAYVASLSGINEPSIEAVLIKRGCLVRAEGRLRPTHAGILLFGRDPARFVRGADITAVRFAGETMSDHHTRQDITGTLPEQIRKAETFLVDNLRKGVALGQTMARAENLEYPLEAARELLVNAVAHRDYSVTGDGIRLFIYRGRMEITSPGGLPGPVTIDNIKDERFSRNPIIVQVLSDMGFIERLGYGVDRVIDLMTAQGMREPEFSETAGGFRVTLFSRADAPADSATSASPAIPERLNGLYKGLPINPRQETALLHLLNGSPRITNSDLQALCPDVHAETIRRDLADLVTKGILSKRGEKRGSYYVMNAE